MFSPVGLNSLNKVTWTKVYPFANRHIWFVLRYTNDAEEHAEDGGGARAAGVSSNLLSVQRNYLSAEQEMRRVFGSRTVCVGEGEG